MTQVWGVLLVALGGLLAGGTAALWKTNRALSVALGLCAVLAVAAGVLRLGYFGA
ncbi:hypothetical protein [Streptomonospora litoralis]|uniref:Uncharacterized protein n=1 Tax=Streptomonospora litoralis TaxID=2498135 RepID=A0A4P6Q1G3_9ACTN|nr:hypothetical protein [Streptomonospora litoralis]QBI53930.1 hypothetical protein EKD16_10720 [Streptomonospora litoralis]